jgi:hypothetical protein
MFKTWIDSAGKMREAEDGGEGKRAKIYAITALGLTDGRMKWVWLTGEAALDGWFGEGQGSLEISVQYLGSSVRCF